MIRCLYQNGRYEAARMTVTSRSKRRATKLYPCPITSSPPFPILIATDPDDYMVWPSWPMVTLRRGSMERAMFAVATEAERSLN
jgi:hypothetical protein